MYLCKEGLRLANNPRTYQPPFHRTWETDIHAKDERGQLLIEGLPYVEYVAMSPKAHAAEQAKRGKGEPLRQGWKRSRQTTNLDPVREHVRRKVDDIRNQVHQA